ncbi:hypothetical protein CEXT_109781 [Caerostris extrusa]|uniref:Uncharacterized protein n=1 Tax=Caerostris extrusa TaxID=172846 RepID=A0AAV4QNC1_CAEEX|nr:hypothetical protein CEXT_109781 [Caerostris extrusa]
MCRGILNRFTPIPSRVLEFYPFMQQSGSRDDSFLQKKGFVSTQQLSFVIRNDFLPFRERGALLLAGVQGWNGGFRKRDE